MGMDMENHNTGIRLFQLIKNRTDEQTALDAMSALQGTIKTEVKYETANMISDVKIELLGKISTTEISLIERINSVKADLMDVKTDLIERINSSKVQTILWIVGMSILQLMARYFFK